MSFEYNDEGIRTSKTVNGVETTHYVNGGQIVAEKTGTRTIVYIYDASGAPIGMMYRTTSYAENVWDAKISTYRIGYSSDSILLELENGDYSYKYLEGDYSSPVRLFGWGN